jgi:hypothetical protein
VVPRGWQLLLLRAEVAMTDQNDARNEDLKEDAEARLFDLVRDIRTGEIPVRDRNGAFRFDCQGYQFEIWEDGAWFTGHESPSIHHEYLIDYGPITLVAHVFVGVGENSINIANVEDDSPLASILITAVRAVVIAKFLDAAICSESCNLVQGSVT